MAVVVGAAVSLSSDYAACCGAYNEQFSRAAAADVVTQQNQSPSNVLLVLTTATFCCLSISFIQVRRKENHWAAVSRLDAASNALRNMQYLSLFFTVNVLIFFYTEMQKTLK